MFNYIILLSTTSIITTCFFFRFFNRKKQHIEFYNFPITAHEIFKNTPDDMSDETRLFRLNIMKMLIKLSRKYTQKDIDSKVYIDIEKNEIIGIDMSQLDTNLSNDFSIGDTQILLKEMTGEMWTNFKI